MDHKSNFLDYGVKSRDRKKYP